MHFSQTFIGRERTPGTALVSLKKFRADEGKLLYNMSDPLVLSGPRAGSRRTEAKDAAVRDVHRGTVPGCGIARGCRWVLGLLVRSQVLLPQRISAVFDCFGFFPRQMKGVEFADNDKGFQMSQEKY